MKTNTRTQGFTLIEILVAIALLGILAAVLTATLTGALGLNRQAQKQVDTTSQVQGILENVRNAWAVQDNYDKACAPNLVIPTGYTVKFINLNSRAESITATGTVATSTTGSAAAPSQKVQVATPCPAASLNNGALVGSTASSSAPVMRRVTVQSGTLLPDSAQNADPTVGPQDVALTLDILRPG